MTDILPADVWIVTHRVGERLVIYSESYQARQGKYLSGRDDFVSPYLYHLFIDSRGRVDRGWLILKNPKTVAFASNRYVLIDPKQRETPGWPDEPLFEEGP